MLRAATALPVAARLRSEAGQFPASANLWRRGILEHAYGVPHRPFPVDKLFLT